MFCKEDLPLDLLIQSPVFAGLDEAALLELIEDCPCRLRHFVKDELLASAGDELRFLYIMIRGHVRGEMVDYSGKMLKIEDIFPPRPLAPAFLFGRQNRYPVNIVAGEEGELLAIPKDAFLRMMQQDARVLQNFIDNISNRGQFLSRKIKFLSFSTIKGKLAQYILDLSAQQQSMHIQMKLSQNQMAELFGVARPSVGRALGEMNREGILHSEGKHHIIKDIKALTDLLK